MKGAIQDIPLRELVPGDIVLLSAGDMIPADVRLITTKDLFISQSILTGESLPVEKYDTLGAVVEKSAAAQGEFSGSTLDLANIAFMGTNVVSGTGVCVVLATGDNTMFGGMARTLTGYRAKTSFDRGINSVSWLLIRFTLVMIPSVLLLNGFIKGDWLDALLFALSVGVGLTPAMMPMIVTSNLALGAVRLSKQKVIVKRLNSIQNLGAIDVLCTDKTGTLTQDKVVLEMHLDLNGEENDDVLEFAYLNSYYQSGLKNLLDVAVLEHRDLATTLDFKKKYFKTDEIPFDFIRRRMSVAVHAAFTGKDLLVTKGAAEEVLSVCSRAKEGDEIVPFSKEFAQKAVPAMRRFEPLTDCASSLWRTRELISDLHKPRTVADETDMILVGFIAFLDPPKASAEQAISVLHNAVFP